MEKDLNDVIAKNIQDLRKKNGLTQIELADKLNYSDKVISKWERGISLPDAITLFNLAKIFNVNINYFFEEHEKEEISLQEVKKLKVRKAWIMFIIFLVFFIVFTFIIGLILITISNYMNLDKHMYISIYMFALAGISNVVLLFELAFKYFKYFKSLISISMWALILAFFYFFYTYNLYVLFLLAIFLQLSLLFFSNSIKKVCDWLLAKISRK